MKPSIRANIRKTFAGLGTRGGKPPGLTLPCLIHKRPIDGKVIGGLAIATFPPRQDTPARHLRTESTDGEME